MAADFDNRDDRGRRRAGAPGSSMGLGRFGPAAERAIDVNALRERLRPHQALALWPQIAGEKLASVCTAEAVRGGVLFVRVKSSAWANEMTFYKADLLGKLNGKLGSKLIDDIHFATGRSASRSSAPPAAQPAQQEVRDLGRIAPPVPPAAAAGDIQAKLDHLVARTRSVLAWKRANGWVPCARCEALFEPPVKQSGKARRAVQTAQICPVCIALTQR